MMKAIGALLIIYAAHIRSGMTANQAMIQLASEIKYLNELINNNPQT